MAQMRYSSHAEVCFLLMRADSCCRGPVPPGRWGTGLHRSPSHLSCHILTTSHSITPHTIGHTVGHASEVSPSHCSRLSSWPGAPPACQSSAHSRVQHGDRGSGSDMGGIASQIRMRYKRRDLHVSLAHIPNASAPGSQSNPIRGISLLQFQWPGSYQRDTSMRSHHRRM